MINTKETCELVSDSQIRDYIVNYLVKYNSKDFINFIDANPNRRKVFISFEYNDVLQHSMFILKTATDYRIALDLVASYAVAMPPRKVVQNGHMSKIMKNIFIEYTQMLNNNDLLDIYDKISDYEESENITLKMNYVNGYLLVLWLLTPPVSIYTTYLVNIKMSYHVICWKLIKLIGTICPAASSLN